MLVIARIRTVVLQTSTDTSLCPVESILCLQNQVSLPLDIAPSHDFSFDKAVGRAEWSLICAATGSIH